MAWGLFSVSLKLFNYGKHQRDFTYIDDIVESIVRLLPLKPVASPGWNAHRPSPSSSCAPWRVLNIGGSQPVELTDYVALLERLMGKKADVELLPLQPGDVLTTCVDTHELEQLTGFKPQISLSEGLARYAGWFKSYYLS